MEKRTIIGNPSTVEGGVTTLILTYNSAKYLEDAVRSAQEQITDFTHKIWICDDSSTDNSRDIALRLFSEDPSRIVLFLQEQNLYQSGVRQRAHYYELIERGFIANLDADDVWLDREKLQRQVNQLRESTSTALVCSRWVRIYESDLHDGNCRQAAYPGGERLFKSASIAARNPICTSATLFRSSDYHRVSSFAPHVPQCQDWELWMALSTIGNVQVLSDISVGLRIHKSSYREFAATVGVDCNPKLTAKNFSRLSLWHRTLFGLGLALRPNLMNNMATQGSSSERVRRKVATALRLVMNSLLDWLAGCIHWWQVPQDSWSQVRDALRARGGTCQNESRSA